MATPTQIRRRGRWSLILGTIFAFVAFAAVAYASDVDVAVVDVTVPTNTVSLAPGGSGNITINLVVTGAQAGTATFEVYRTWTLSGGSFVGSNPQEFTVGPRAGGNPATTFSTSGTVTIGSSQAPGDFTLAASVFDITNTNSTGAKLAAGDPSNYQVTVMPPLDSTAPVITPIVIGTAGNNDWYTSNVSLAWTVVDSESAISSQTGCGTVNITADLADTTYTCQATSAGGTASKSVTIKRDATNPMISASAGGYTSGTWTNEDVTVRFTCMDVLSGMVGCPSDVVVSTDTPAEGTDVSGSASDNAGNSATSNTINVKVDKTAPTISGSRLPLANAAGWNNTDVEVSFTCEDQLSDVASCGPTPVTVSANGADLSVGGTAVDNAGNTETTTVGGINIDKLAPSVAYTSVSPVANVAGWHKTDVTVTFTATDTLSGFAPSGVLTTTDTSTTSGEGSNVEVSSPAFVDRAGNSAAAGAARASFKIDKTAPTVGLVSGPANGGAYYFGSVPAAPTCSASDSLSGLDGACSVSGYDTSVGSHTLSASAKDVAGNVGSSAPRTYTVLAWTLNGFFQPVDMNGVFNTVKSGSTVPLKFRVFSGSTELTDIAAVKSMSVAKIACASGVGEDPIEETAPTGGTVLRYDSTGAQFIFNWKTSGRAGDCYRVTMTTQDLSTIVALFKLR